EYCACAANDSDRKTRHSRARFMGSLVLVDAPDIKRGEEKLQPDQRIRAVVQAHATHSTLPARKNQKPKTRLRAERDATSQAAMTVTTIAGHWSRSRMSMCHAQTLESRSRFEERAWKSASWVWAGWAPTWR